MTNIEDVTDIEEKQAGPVSSNLLSYKGVEGNRLAATHFSPQERRAGPPALLMHGGGQTRYSWDGAAQQLARLGLDSVTVDARGHGESDWVETGNYTFHYFRDDLICLVDQIRAQFGQAPVLIGASMGGISALLAQEKAGSDIFSAIVLVDITPRMESSGVDRIMGFMAQNMKEGFASVEDAADVIAAYLPNRPRPKSLDGLSKNLRQRDDKRWYWHWDPAFVESVNSVKIGREERTEVLVEATKKISVPSLLVRGGKSELVTEEAAREFLELVPHAKYVDVSDAGHMVAGDRNDIFAQAVISFLKSDVLSS